ncbi:hypothetical protein [Enterococcus sp. HMSC14A10]|nr:hypothetical protein [Enterococcus sp. HMSC14A10]
MYNNYWVKKMIPFPNKVEFIKAGFNFSDFFDEMLFDYFVAKDGYMFFNPLDNFMYNKAKIRIFSVIIEKL